MRQLAIVTTRIGSASSTANPRIRSLQVRAKPRACSRASVRSIQEFGSDRLRAHASHSVALAESGTPQLPHSEYTRTPCAETWRRIGRDALTIDGGAVAAATDARRRARHWRQARNRLTRSRRDCMARSLERIRPRGARPVVDAVAG